MTQGIVSPRSSSEQHEPAVCGTLEPLHVLYHDEPSAPVIFRVAAARTQPSAERFFRNRRVASLLTPAPTGRSLQLDVEVSNEGCR